MAENGYIKLARKSIESEIWLKPPLYWKIWTYILMKANFTDTEYAEAGTLFVTIDELIEAGSHYSGYRKIKPTKKQIWTILEYLRKPHGGNAEGTMVETRRGTHGLFVKVHKYRLYQHSDAYGGNYGGNYGGDTDGTVGELNNNKNYKNVRIKNNKLTTTGEKNEKKSNIPTLEEVKEECRRRGYIVSSDSFFETYEKTNWKNPEDDKPIRSWKAVLKAWNEREVERLANQPKKRSVGMPDYLIEQRDEFHGKSKKKKTTLKELAEEAKRKKEEGANVK